MQLSDALLQDSKVVYNHIENQTVTPITKRNKHFQILTYFKLNNLDIEYDFDKQQIKVDREELPKRAEHRAYAFFRHITSKKLSAIFSS
jgi:hypothetical protein